MACNKPPAWSFKGNSNFNPGFYPSLAGTSKGNSNFSPGFYPSLSEPIPSLAGVMPRQASLPVHHPRPQVGRTSSDNSLYRGRENPYHSEQEGKRFSCGQLFVKIIKADGIKGDEVGGLGKADPYAVVKFGGDVLGITEVKTKAHIDAGSKPHWKDTVSFYIYKEHNDYNKLSISIRNKNTFRTDNTLGEFRKEDMGPFVTGDGKNQQLARWYPLLLRGEERGRILLAFDFIPMSPEAILESISANSSDVTAHYKYSHVQAGKWVSITAVGALLAAAQLAVAAAAL